MKLQLKLESLAEFLLSIFVFSRLEFAWYWYPALLLLPDLSMIGYAFSPRIGAVIYNFFHNKALGVVVALAGFSIANPILLLAGVILFGHSAMDRIFGYGLKFPDDFKNTHLGRISN